MTRTIALSAAFVVAALAGALALGVGSTARPTPRPVTGPTVRTNAAPDTAASGRPKTTRRAPARPASPPVRPRRSRALGLPWAGRLVRGVRLPAQGAHFFTWDAILRGTPNRPWRRWGTDGLVRTTLRVVREYAAAHPSAPRVGIGDLSRPRGGDFGPRFGGLGHRSHQNGLDVDVYYPRRDRRERSPRTPEQVDRRLAQDLVDRFVAAGAVRVFVGPNVGLKGPPRVVQVLAHHDDHLHVRLPRGRARRAGATP